MTTYFSRMGDGSAIEVTADEIKADLIAGSEDAADRGNIPPLTEEEYAHLLDIFTTKAKFVSVEPGNEVILTYTIEY